MQPFDQAFQAWLFSPIQSDSAVPGKSLKFIDFVVVSCDFQEDEDWNQHNNYLKIDELETWCRIWYVIWSYLGRNPLHVLAVFGKENSSSIFELFVECMAQYPVNAVDAEGNTPLLLAYTKVIPVSRVARHLQGDPSGWFLAFVDNRSKARNQPDGSPCISLLLWLKYCD